MIILLTSQWVTFYTLIISTMTNYDVDLELKEQQISLYEDGLSMFIDRYQKEKEFRELLKKKYDTYIDYEEWDECYGMYFWDDVLYMSIHLDKCLEKMFNCINNEEYKRKLETVEESFLPF